MSVTLRSSCSFWIATGRRSSAGVSAARYISRALPRAMSSTEGSGGAAAASSRACNQTEAAFVHEKTQPSVGTKHHAIKRSRMCMCSWAQAYEVRTKQELRHAAGQRMCYAGNTCSAHTFCCQSAKASRSEQPMPTFWAAILFCDSASISA